MINFLVHGVFSGEHMIYLEESPKMKSGPLWPLISGYIVSLPQEIAVS